MPARGREAVICSCQIERFWKRVSRSAGCWLWTGASDGRYGQAHVNKKPVKAHRLSWILSFGDIPSGLLVLHRCDNPPCVNPAHLFLGTSQDNSDDKHAKGRNRSGIGEKCHTAVLCASLVVEIRRRHQQGESHARLAREFGVSPSSIGRAATRETWRHVP